ncbi:epiphycan-like [Arapaima gigas]
MWAHIVCWLFILNVVAGFPSRHPRQLELDTYNNAYNPGPDSVLLEDVYYYDVGPTINEPQIEIVRLPPLVDNFHAPAASLEEEEEELSVGPLPTSHTSGGSGVLMGPDGSGVPDRSTCMLCTCLGGSVYCDDLKLESVPPLHKDTTHFYARFNKISKISKSDFAHLNKLKRIDLTHNKILRIDEDAFIGLPALEELVLQENQVSQLPALPASMTLIDASHNKLGGKGIHREAFKDMHGLLYLYLTDNNIGHIPLPLPESLRSLHLQNNNIQMLHEDTFCNLKDINYIRKALEDIRLDGNPINLSKTPQAYTCLPRVPIGGLF